MKIKFLPYIYVLLVLVVFILPFYTAEGYEITRHTTSQLGSQNTPNSWIMNSIFVLLGLSTIVDSLPRLKGFASQKVLIIIFGISLIMTAVFSHAPITDGVSFNQVEDQWHSNFASITGFGFTLYAISVAFIRDENLEKILAIVAGVLATLLSLLFFTLPDYAGVWQRIIFLGSFAWLIYDSSAKHKMQSR